MRRAPGCSWLLAADCTSWVGTRRDLKELLDAYEKDPRCFYLYTGRVRAPYRTTAARSLSSRLQTLWGSHGCRAR